MKKVVLFLVVVMMATASFGQAKKNDTPVKKSDTARLALSAHNIETLSALVKRANAVRAKIDPLQKELNLVDSTFNAVLETKLDAQGYDPKKGRWGIIGNDLLYIPNKIDSAKATSVKTTKPK